ncbi:MAG TPA: hypothetical protein VG325_13780 [Solirubrobacteraceae bacterium]|jgi:hypothetical protein|nr:hypothetical protein [Solirubrobacteraceae bacterium]
MESPKLQWSAAEVSEGVLTVAIDGDRPKAWKNGFEQVVTPLGGGQWGEGVCKPGKARASGVADGREDRLHHYPEGVMQEANAAFDTTDGRDERDDGGPGDSDQDGADNSDARMTERFRNLGA